MGTCTGSAKAHIFSSLLLSRLAANPYLVNPTTQAPKTARLKYLFVSQTPLPTCCSKVFFSRARVAVLPAVGGDAAAAPPPQRRGARVQSRDLFFLQAAPTVR